MNQTITEKTSILIFVGNYLFKRGNSDHYKNYNRVIDEPDSISVIEDQF